MYGVNDASVEALGQAWLDEDHGLPSWMTFTRGAGSWSRQTAAAVNGTTFIETGTSQNTARFDYDPTSGRRMLLIEPTRTNIVTNADFVDTTPANGTPDGWTKASGVENTDYQCVAGGPHGGVTYRSMTDIGRHYVTPVVPGGTTFATSVWVRRVTANGALTIFSIDVPPGTGSIALGAAVHDWQRYIGTETTVGAGAAAYFLYPSVGNDDVYLVLPQAEAGDCATSFTAATRAAELCAVDPSVIGANQGYVSFLWRPDYASTASLSLSPVLFQWAPNWELYFDPADDKLKLTVDSAAGAESAALTFARQGLMHVAVRYGAFGTRLYVDGVETTDASAWGAPALAPYLGSRAASANCRPSAFGSFLSTAL